MANQTTIGELNINLKMRLEELEKGINNAKKKLQEIESSNKQVENSNKNLDASYLAMSATAVIALGKIGSAIKESINEYKSYTQAMSSLENVSEYTGQSMQDLSKIMNKFGAYMTKSDLATTIKNFSLMGFEAEQTEKMIEALTNSAIRNRTANYSVSEAVRVASEGYRQGLSTLSDSAGVTENLSVMLDNYAKSIGKTASQLTEAEKNQAYLNRTMYAAEPFASAMSDYMDTLAGKQGEYSQSLRETQVAYAEALEPTLVKITEGGTGLLNIIGSLIKEHPTLTTGMTTFAVTLAGVTVAMIALKTANEKFAISSTVATVATEGFTAALKANPIFFIVSAIAAVISGISMLCSAIRENEEAQAKLNETTERYNKIKEGKSEYTDKEIQDVEKNKENVEEQIRLLNEQIRLQEIIDEYEKQEKEKKQDTTASDSTIEITKKQYEETKKSLKNINKQYQDNIKTNGEYGKSIEELNGRLNHYNAYLRKVDTQKNISNLIDTESIKNKKKEAATAVETAKSYQQLFQTYQKGEKGTKEYENAVAELEKKFPEAVNANGIMAEEMKTLIDKMAQDAGISWNNTQATIQERIDKITEAIANCQLNIDKDGTYAKSLAEKIKVPTEQVIPTLQTALNLFNMLLNKDSTQVGGAKSTYTAPKISSGGSKGGGSKSYSNKALDEYKKQIEHKKALDQISLQEEINMYQYALKKYAKTQDEKWELTEKIYSLQKEIQEKSLDDYTAVIEHRKNLDQISLQEEINMYQYAYNALAKTTEQKQELEEKLYELRKELAQKNKELLDQQTTDYERYIQNQKNLRGAEYDTKEQEEDLNKIINLHRSYLNQIMKDERLSLDERKELYQEELDTIRDYEQQKRDLRVQSVDDTVSQLTSAITKQLEEMEEADKKAIEENIKLVEEWKEVRINAINEEYETRIEAIQKELDLLDKSEEEKTRAEEDAEFERKRNRLQQLVDFEHDATTKANYQKELDKLIADYQKTLDKRALQDKKDALKEQQDLLKEEQDNKVQAIEDEAEKKKEQYDKQLDELEEYYEKQKELAQETAEKMLLNVEQNQNEILKLLNSYGNAYEITGQTLGEKLAQGINNGIADKIQNIIQKVQDTIDAGIENKIKEWTAGMYKYEAKGVGNTIINKTVNVEQNNTITTPVDSPSVAYKKQETLNRNLANEIAYVF